jgi:hypothetical protein
MPAPVRFIVATWKHGACLFFSFRHAREVQLTQLYSDVHSAQYRLAWPSMMIVISLAFVWTEWPDYLRSDHHGAALWVALQLWRLSSLQSPCHCSMSACGVIFIFFHCYVGIPKELWYHIAIQSACERGLLVLDPILNRQFSLIRTRVWPESFSSIKRTKLVSHCYPVLTTNHSIANSIRARVYKVRAGTRV